MLALLDVLFTLLHLLIIGFNLFGWIWPATRKLHLWCVGATAFSWLILGIWFGLGYCPITDYQWQIKEKLGEQNLPNFFIKYYADYVSGKDINPGLIDTATAVLFALAVLLSIYVNTRLGKLQT
ncbi:MAG: DUF2784 domain-containing protein [Bacteroidota bacterium]|nr:DUF2784 domain-containing protein [Bacteroidota bacterium]